MQIPLRRKYRPEPKLPFIPVEGQKEVLVRSSNDYYAKKIDSGSNDQNPKHRTKTGLKTYDRTKHVMWVYPSGKRKMVHL